jgi:hypothetical protein
MSMLLPMSVAGARPLAGRIPAAAAPMSAALFFRNFLRPDDLDSMGDSSAGELAWNF